MGKVGKTIGLFLFALLIGLASFSLYKIFNQGSADVLLRFGIENFYLQNGMIIIIALILLILFSAAGAGAIIKDIVKT